MAAAVGPPGARFDALLIQLRQAHMQALQALQAAHPDLGRAANGRGQGLALSTGGDAAVPLLPGQFEAAATRMETLESDASFFNGLYADRVCSPPGDTELPDVSCRQSAILLGVAAEGGRGKAAATTTSLATVAGPAEVKAAPLKEQLRPPPQRTARRKQTRASSTARGSSKEKPGMKALTKDGDEGAGAEASQSEGGFTFELGAPWRPESHRSSMRKASGRRRSCLHFATMNEERENEQHTIRSDHPLQRFVLHPSCLRRLAWDLTSMTLLGYDIMAIPFIGAFAPRENDFLTGMTWSTLIFWTLDMPLSMLTGYQQGKLCILCPRMTSYHYVRTWFILDVLIVGLDWTSTVITSGSDGTDGGSVTRLGRTLRTLRFVRTLRLIRVLKLKKIVQAIQDSINTEAISIIFGIIKIIFFLIVANHIVACGWYSIGSSNSEAVSWVTVRQMDQRTVIYRYVTSLHWSLTQFTPASMEVSPESTAERIFAVIVILFAMIAFSSFVSILTASMNQLNQLGSNESRQFWLLRRYLRDWDVRRKVALRVQRYAEYAYQKQKCRVQEHEVALLSLLSEPLRLELKHETFSGYLGGHPLFRLCHDQSRVFGKALHASSVAHQEVLFTCDQQAVRLIFLSSGCLEYTLGEPDVDMNDESALFSPTSSQAMSDNSTGGHKPAAEMVYEGTFIAEAALWVKEWWHFGDLTAVTECQVVCVNAEAFCASVQANRFLWPVMSKYAENFVKRLDEYDAEDFTDLNAQMFNPREAIEQDNVQEVLQMFGAQFGGADDMENAADRGWIFNTVRYLKAWYAKRSLKEEGKKDSGFEPFSPRSDSFKSSTVVPSRFSPS